MKRKGVESIESGGTGANTAAERIRDSESEC